MRKICYSSHHTKSIRQGNDLIENISQYIKYLSVTIKNVTTVKFKYKLQILLLQVLWHSLMTYQSIILINETRETSVTTMELDENKNTRGQGHSKQTNKFKLKNNRKKGNYFALSSITQLEISQDFLICFFFQFHLSNPKQNLNRLLNGAAISNKNPNHRFIIW